MFLTSYIKETPEGNFKADIHQTQTGFVVEYFKPNGENFRTEDHSGHSIHYVKSAVENWIGNIKTLNG